MRLAATGLAGVAALALTALPVTQAAGSSNQVGLNVVLNTDLTPAIVSELSSYGAVNEQYPEVDGLTMRVPASAVARVKGLPYVEGAHRDVPVSTGPVTRTVAPLDTTTGSATWNTDQIDVYDVATNQRVVPETGAGVYVAVLDTGLHSTWPYYFGDRVAADLGVAIGGGGGERGSISFQPNKWGQDQNGHGTHVTSTVVGYNMNGTLVGGVAPRATVIPVKVLNQNGSGWSSVVAAGIDYVSDLKEGPLKDVPVVINMSLGGPAPDELSQRAIERAVDLGILVVAAAGNEGEAGMGWPGAYPEVISVAASGWVGEWRGGGAWWRTSDVEDPTTAAQSYITPFSSRERAGQQLDVAAPGSWIVGPYQTNGQASYYFMGGTSMASPHVAGAVALMAQQNPTLSQAAAEATLKGTAVPLGEGSRQILDPNTGAPTTVSWRSDATGAGIIDVPAALGYGAKASASTTGTPGGQGKGRSGR